MTDEQAFWAALAAEPNDDLRWLVYADWLEEHGSSAGPFVRLMVEFAGGPHENASLTEFVERYYELWPALAPKWRIDFVSIWRCRTVVFHVEKYHQQRRPSRVVVGVVAAGTIRVGEELEVPWSDGSRAPTQILGIETFARPFDSVTLGHQIQFGLLIEGRRGNDLTVLPGTVIRSPPPSAENDRSRRKIRWSFRRFLRGH